MRRIFYIAFLFVSSFNIVAQDIHFSQFFNTPIQTNPGNTGFHDEQYRFAANQRVQYRSISGNPYNTFAISADGNNIPKLGKLNAGVDFLHDITGDSHYRTIAANLNLAYSIWESTDTSHKIQAGLGLGFTQQRFSLDDLTWNNQYNGISYDPNLPSNENFTRQKLAYMNLSAGLSYQGNLSPEWWLEGGLAAFNLLGPQQNFDALKSSLERRFHLFGRAQYQINPLWFLQPAISLMHQGPYNEIISGASVKYVLKDDRGIYTALYGGTYYRLKDAGYLKFGADYNQWHAAISYDFNLSNLKPASSYRGGWEIAVIYKFTPFVYKDIPHKVCPSYMK